MARHAVPFISQHKPCWRRSGEPLLNVDVHSHINSFYFPTGVTVVTLNKVRQVKSRLSQQPSRYLCAGSASQTINELILVPTPPSRSGRQGSRTWIPPPASKISAVGGVCTSEAPACNTGRTMDWFWRLQDRLCILLRYADLMVWVLRCVQYSEFSTSNFSTRIMRGRFPLATVH